MNEILYVKAWVDKVDKTFPYLLIVSGTYKALNKC